MTLRTLTSADELTPALDIFARVLQAPAFDAAVVEREKARTIANLKDQDTKPDTLASKTFYARIYGSHPYALRSTGEPDTVAKLTAEDVAAFYRSYYTVDQAVIAIVGDMTREAAQALALKLTASLPASTVRAVIPDVPEFRQPDLSVVAHPATQSHVLVGAPGISRSDPDYFPLYVGNYILGGGGFVSRILDEVRSKRGLAYSAYSYFEPLKARGPFVIGLQTRRDQAAEALGVVRDTVRRFVADGPTERELVAAKQNIIGGFPLRIDSNRKLLDYLELIGIYGLPLTYLDDFIPNVQKVSVADIRRAFAKHVDPEHLETVVVGADETAFKASVNAR
jgi:zinc protease